jgi:hypothetical protein
VKNAKTFRNLIILVVILSLGIDIFLSYRDGAIIVQLNSFRTAL